MSEATLNELLDFEAPDDRRLVTKKRPAPGIMRRAAILIFAIASLLAAAFACARPANAQSKAAGQDGNIAPKVIAVTGGIELGQSVIVDVERLSDWVKLSPDNDARKLVLYLNGKALTGIYPEAVYLSKNRLQFHLKRTPDSKEAWADLLREPVFLRPVAFTVGLEDRLEFDTTFDHDNKLPLTVLSTTWGSIALTVLALILILFVTLAVRTNIIRDRGPNPATGKRRPYNLGRAQMAFWFFLVFTSYVTIWLITGDLDTITQSILGLIGISAGTALGADVIDSSKEGARGAQLQALSAEKNSLDARTTELKTQLASIEAKASSNPSTVTATDLTTQSSLGKELQEKLIRLELVNQSIAALSSATYSATSVNFLHDLLSDNNGYSFHRFQIFAWTIVLGIIFIVSVYKNLAMPEFSATLLGLMGISAGTYIGFKFPEQK